MDPTKFTAQSAGRIVKVGLGEAAFRAFIPNPLPAPFVWSGDTVRLLSAADRALGELAGVGRRLPNPHLLIGPFKRREAVLSSRIEGTQASMSDLVLFEAAPEREQRVEDVREVVNYVRALEHGLERQTTLPLSLRLIREMHKLLMEGVRGNEKTPGEFRTSQNWIGPPGCALDDATFVPTPKDDLPEVLAALERFLHAKSDLPPLVRLAMVHYQFEAIHPFLHGNGRIGRLLITLLLCVEGILPGPLLYLSAYFQKSRDEYYRLLLAVSQEGRWNEWVEYFLRGVAEQAMDAVERAARLLELREEFWARLHGVKASALPLRLADALFQWPAVSVPAVGKLLAVTPRSAQKIVDKLVAAKILEEATGRRRNRVFIAREIVRAVE